MIRRYTLACALCLLSLYSHPLRSVAQMEGGPTSTVYGMWYVAGTYYTCSSDGFFTSPDATTWHKIHEFGLNGASLVALPSGEIFLFGYNSFEMSTDAGQHWKTVQQPGFSTRTVIADSMGYLYAGENDPIRRSTDKGATWEEVANGTSPNFFDIGEIVLGADGAIYAGNQGITGGMLYRSTDHGANWTLLHSESMKDVASLEVYPNGKITVWYADKVIRSNDGSTWRTLVNPAAKSYPHSSTFFSMTRGYALTQKGKVVTTTDGGEHWDSTGGEFAIGSFNHLWAMPNGKLYASNSIGLNEITITASVKPEMRTEPLLLAPNPAQNVTSFEVPLTGSGIESVEIYNAGGARVQHIDHRVTGSRCEINTSGLAAGTYVIVAHTGEGVHTSKLVVTR